MNTTGKIAIGVSFASSVLLAAWLLTGQRKEKTKDFVYKGAESLRIKETDRIAALQTELAKIGADLVEIDSGHWTLNPASKLPNTASFNTYKDHRMAMAFAPLATLMNVEIENPDVVRKSYPNFWNDMKTVGFEIQSS